MVTLQELVTFLDQYLNIKAVSDNSWNGLQATGKPLIKKIALAVDACAATFEKAAMAKADFVIAHHGHFWRSINPSLVGWKHNRVKALMDNGISLYAAHLPLDRHEEVGNNAQLLQLLGAKIYDKFLSQEGVNVSWLGRLPKPVPLADLEMLLNQALVTECIVLPFGAEVVETIAVCSGGGGYAAFYEALEQNVDAYVTGEITEVYQTAKDAGMNVIFAGHYATETLGLKALGEIIKENFKVSTVFLNSPTGL